MSSNLAKAFDFSAARNDWLDLTWASLFLIFYLRIADWWFVVGGIRLSRGLSHNLFDIVRSCTSSVAGRDSLVIFVCSTTYILSRMTSSTTVAFCVINFLGQFSVYAGHFTHLGVLLKFTLYDRRTDAVIGDDPFQTGQNIPSCSEVILSISRLLSLGSSSILNWGKV